MADHSYPAPSHAPGEAPETLSNLQVLLAHLVVLAVALFFLRLWFAEAEWPRLAQFALAIGSGLASLCWFFQLPRLPKHELAALGALVVLLAAVLALAVS